MDFEIENIPIHIEELDSDPINVPGPSNAIIDQEMDFISENENSDDHSEQEDVEDDFSTRRKVVSKLSVHMKGLMGEANLRYAKGDLETSKKMCFEVIRQESKAYEPYLTLSQVYENTNSKKHKAYLMLANHLAPGKKDIACRLAELYLQDGEINEAIKCYSRTLRYLKTDISIYLKKIDLLEKKGETKLLLSHKQTMVRNISVKHSKLIMNVSMEVAKEYFKDKKYHSAIETLEIPIRRIPKEVTNDLINMILELYIINECYSKCLDIFTEFCGFSFDISVTENNTIIVNTYISPENLQIDLKIKFIICLIKLRADNLFPQLINEMLIEDDVEMFGDLYLDVVEALMITDYQQEALKLLVPLVKSKSFSLAGVWLKYAECLAACEMLEQATDAYYEVMKLAPSHIEALYPLAMLLLKQNKRTEALQVLSQDLSTNKLDVAVLIEQMKLLRQINDWKSYWKSCELLLSRHCIVLKYSEELKIVMTRDTYNQKAVRLKKMRNFRSENTEIETDFVSIREPSVEEEYDLYKEILQMAKDKEEYGLLQKFTFMGLCSKRFTKYFNEIYLMAFFSCLLCSDIFHGYNIIRDLLIRYPKVNLCWNWFGIMTATPDDIRHTRFLERSSALHIDILEKRRKIVANNDVWTGNYISGINYFLKDLKETNSAYSAFMLSIVMLQYQFQRNIDRSKKKMLAETVTYLFLNYSMLRSKKAAHEVYYNLGRMYHQLGIIYLAEYYYKKVFEVHNELLEKYPHILCLKYEAAFNLHLIYKNNGNLIAARNILYEHIVI
nr:general transcription factor 3C polypeptide 3 isoform X2 [Leptinotarsa decemlineata]